MSDPIAELDTISVHRRNEIRVWDENSRRPVTCGYQDTQEDAIKALLRRRVLVSGLIAYNRQGHPISMNVANIVDYPSASARIPRIEEMVGLVDNLTGGLTLADYLEQLRDG